MPDTNEIWGPIKLQCLIYILSSPHISSDVLRKILLTYNYSIKDLAGTGSYIGILMDFNLIWLQRQVT